MPNVNVEGHLSALIRMTVSAPERPSETRRGTASQNWPSKMTVGNGEEAACARRRRRTDHGWRSEPECLTRQIGVSIMRTMLTPWMLCKSMSMALALGFSLVSCSSQRAERKAAVKKPILGPETAGSLLSQFSDASRQRLEATLFNERFDGVIESAFVEDIIRLQGGAM